MRGKSPDEIWEEGLDEGERRLSRAPTALAATGFAGGIDVAIGLLIAAATTGALVAVMPEAPAHVVGSLTFGVAFALITLGRAELFTENFLIPVGAVYAGRAPLRLLLRMWGITFVLNAIGLLLFAAILSYSGVLEKSTLAAVGTLADTQVARHAGAAFLSAVVAGTIITLFTWVAAAAEQDSTRLLAALVVGFVLLAPSLNHSVVSFGEITFALASGTTVATFGTSCATPPWRSRATSWAAWDWSSLPASPRCAASPAKAQAPPKSSPKHGGTEHPCMVSKVNRVKGVGPTCPRTWASCPG